VSQPAALSLVHRVRQPAATHNPPPLLLMLHGVGSNEEDLLGLESELDPRFVVVSARGPNILRPGSYAWFQVEFTPAGPVINPEQAEASRLTLIDFIAAAAAAYAADPARIYLMGFSQGAIMSASLALTVPDRIAGAVLMSGRILPQIKDLIAPRERLGRLPVLLIHGTEDATLPIQHGRASRDLLTSLGVNVRYQEYRMGHQITAASLALVASWLTMQLGESPTA
jgi:phospholipase/carboxylesterase